MQVSDVPLFLALTIAHARARISVILNKVLSFKHSLLEVIGFFTVYMPRITRRPFLLVVNGKGFSFFIDLFSGKLLVVCREKMVLTIVIFFI